MGQELPCTVRAGGRVGSGKAYLEAREIRFRGDFPLKIALADMRSVAARDGTLVIKTAAGESRFEIGKAAAIWADKILHPKSRIDKLGVKAGHRVAVLNVDDAALSGELAGRKAVMLAKPAKGTTDLIFLGLDTRSDLARFAKLRAALAPDGAIWAVARKGKDAPLKDIAIIGAGRAANLVDNKVVAFSETHSALRFSIPKAERRG